MKFVASIAVMPKAGISDPQGETIERALPNLGFKGIDGVRVGKRIELVIEASDQAEARRILEEACKKFLSNPVIEDYEFTLEPGEAIH